MRRTGGWISNRAWKAGAGLALAGAGLLLYARWVEPYWTAVEHVTLTLPRLAPAFDGYRIAHVSDFHLDGWMTAERLRRVVALTNEQAPDLIAITGDFVSVSDRYISDIPGPLSELQAPDGAVATLGNHDHMNDAEAVRRALHAAGVTDVSNTVRTINRDGAALHLCGVDDATEGFDDLDAVLGALDGANPSSETRCAVLLAHEPDLADRVAATGRFDLQLSGHSHGGQLRVPLLGAPLAPPLSRRYPSGLYEVDGMYLYTNRGLGVMQARFRLNCRPEVTVLTLRSPGGTPHPSTPARAAPYGARFYGHVGGLYDAVVGLTTSRARGEAVKSLKLAPDDRLLVAGVGSGLDLPLLPRETRGLGVDVNEALLRRARERRGSLEMPDFELQRMDEERLDLPDACFDAVYLPFVLTVVYDGPRVLAEAARVAKPGARIAILDRFWPEGRPQLPVGRAASEMLGTIFTYPDRRFSDVHSGAPGLEVLEDEPSGPGNFFRRVTLLKPG